MNEDVAASLPRTVPNPFLTPPQGEADSDAPLPAPATVNDPFRTVDYQPTPAPDTERLEPTLPEIPGFVLEQEMGRGGMGVVYRARQVPLNRVVALKMILAGDHASAVAKARFLAEAEAVAKVRHPGIVQVHEYGTHQGHPFFALEYVDGGSLDHRLRQGPLLANEAATLVAHLADAMAAAHAQGIVHRDLKPANVLLGNKEPEDASTSPAAKITDFGLAKQLEAGPGLTASGAIMGTPSYMAPEQAAGNVSQVGPVTDVYALGAILYECLTGRPPFRGATVFDTIDQVLRQEPVAVRHLQPSVPRDVETICHKSLSKEPDKRYASAAALAADLRSHLEGRPITARPVGRLERMWKWCRRYPTAAALILVSTLAAVAASGLAAWAVTERQEARTAAEAERRAKLDADHKRQLAEKAEEETYLAYEKLTSEKSLTFLKKVERLSPEQREFLQSAAEFFRKATAQAGTSEKSRVRAAKGHFQLGFLLIILGDKVRATEIYRQGLALTQTLVQDFPGVPMYRQELANGHNTLGAMLTGSNKHAEAEAAFRLALAVQEALVQDFPAVPAYRQELAYSHNNLGALLDKLGQRGKAEVAQRQALAVQEALVRDFPTVPEYRQDLATSHHNLGASFQDLGQVRKAELAYRQALALEEALVRDHPVVPEYRLALAKSYGSLGVALARLGKTGEAETAFRQSLSLREGLVQDFPAVLEHRQELATSHHDLGILLKEQGKWKDAEASYRKALALNKALAHDFPTVSTHHLSLASSQTALANLLADQGKLVEAEALYRQCLAVHEALVREFPTVPAYRLDLAGSYVNFGYLLRDQGRHAEALTWYGQAVPLLEDLLRQEPRHAISRLFLRNAHWGQALTLIALGRFPDAVPAWDLAIKFNDEPKRRAAFRRDRASAVILTALHHNYAWPLLWSWPRH